jgi:5-(carboxyamino)imidazole ribonucleotide mutase
VALLAVGDPGLAKRLEAFRAGQTERVLGLHLPGMLAAKTILPVLGVPVTTTHLQGLDSLLSIVQMPAGVPVATFAIGAAGAHNAGLYAVALLAVGDPGLAKRLEAFRAGQTERMLGLHLPGPA